MKLDLKSMTRKELEKLRTDIDRELKRTIARDKKAAIAAATKAARDHGFDLADVTEAPKATKTRKTPAKKAKAALPKFANPNDKAQKWTGKGRQPQWYKDAIAAGKTRDDLLI